jgi:hypothetical protein
MSDNFPEDVEEEEVPASAAPSAPKKVIGRPITKENCRQYQLSAARAKKLRREARAKLLHGLVAEDVDMVAELKKAIRDNDETKISILEKAIKLVGLSFDQSDEGRIQNLHLDAKTDSKVSGNVNITVKGLDGD